MKKNEFAIEVTFNPDNHIVSKTFKNISSIIEAIETIDNTLLGSINNPKYLTKLEIRQIKLKPTSIYITFSYKFIITID